MNGCIPDKKSKITGNDAPTDEEWNKEFSKSIIRIINDDADTGRCDLDYIGNI